MRGLANVDITSEVAVRLAMAYGTVLKKGSVVCTSRDTSRVARALKRAIIAGLNLSGVHVMDLELSTVPVTRFQVRSERAQGGISVRLAPDDPDSVEIRFIDAKGADIDGRCSARSSGCCTAKTSAARSRPTSATSCSRPARSSSTRPRSKQRRRRCAPAPFVQGRARLLVGRGVGGHAARARQDRGVGAGVNPYAATVGATVDDLETRVKILGDLVRTSDRISGSSSTPTVRPPSSSTTKEPRSPRTRRLLVIVELVCSTRPHAHIALPVSVSREVERIAERHGATITWTKLSATHLMEVAQQRGIDLAASQEGGFIWPSFLPAYDAAATLAHLLGLLATADRTLSAMVASMPATHVAHESVPTPWERKGAVMRGMVERAAGHPTVLVDGVKIVYPDGWALVLPDPRSR